MLPTADAFLAWYDLEKRDLPWRSVGKPDPYRIWLSEIMLQQTTVKAVIPYFEKFVGRWKTVDQLAAASLDDVLALWSGLGYYSRARNLHQCAQVVAQRPGCKFPDTVAELEALPGIGPYTAAAIAAIAFGKPVTPIDSNVERVIARLFAVNLPMPSAKAEIKKLVSTLTPVHRPGDFAQALMDLGATICTPKRPSCLMCPVQRDCRAHQSGVANELPIKKARAERPVRYGIFFLVQREDGAILLRKRPPAGLLGGMLEVPSSDWSDTALTLDEALTAPPVQGNWWLVPGHLNHTFTHFRLEIQVLRAIVPLETPLTFWAEPNRCLWVPRRNLQKVALPSLMRKILMQGLK